MPRVRAHQGDWEDPEEYDSLLDGRRPKKSSGPSIRSNHGHQDQIDLATADLWIPATLIGVFYGGGITGLWCALLLFVNFWLALLVGSLFAFFILPAMATPLFASFFKDASEVGSSRWKSSLRWCVVLGGVVAMTAALSGGSYYREYTGAIHGTTVATAEATDVPADGVTQISAWAAGAVPRVGLSAYYTSYLMFTTCVAPIGTSDTMTTANYWAIATGSCCKKTPPDCDSWSTDGLGGVKLIYTDLAVGAVNAKLQVKANHNVGDTSTSMLVVYGKSTTIVGNNGHYGRLLYGLLTLSVVLVVGAKALLSKF